MTKPLVYIAGPYSKPDPCENTHGAVMLADRILDVCWPVVPHLSHFWHTMSPKPYPLWLELDLAIMVRCDAVFRFGGESSGSDAEIEVALGGGIPVVYSEAELREWVASQ